MSTYKAKTNTKDRVDEMEPILPDQSRLVKGDPLSECEISVGVMAQLLKLPAVLY
jgi:hypothetical protein